MDTKYLFMILISLFFVACKDKKQKEQPMRLRNFTTELSDINTQIANDSGNADLYYKRAFLYFDFDNVDLDPEDKFEDADKYLTENNFEDLMLLDIKKALELNPKQIKAYCLLGDYYYMDTNMEEALSAYDNALNIDSRCKEAILGKGKVTLWDAVEDDDYEHAIKYLNQAIGIDYNYTEAYRERAKVYSLMSGKEDLELQDLNKVLELEPSDFETRYARATYYIDLDLGKEDFAITDLTQVIKEDVNNNYLGIYPYKYRAEAYQKIKKPKEALKDYDTALLIAAKEEPCSYLVYSYRADFYEEEGEYANAIADYSKAIELSPKEDPLYFYHRANLYNEVGKYNEALSDYNKVLEIDCSEYKIFDIKSAAEDQINRINNRRK